MATEAKLRQLADRGCPVYYFYSSERYLVRQAVSAAVRILSADTDEEATVLDGAAPEIEQLIMAAGTISFFGTRRVVVLPELDPAAYSDKDLEELCSTLASLENAVVVLGSVFELERSKLKTGKRAQKLIAECKKLGFAEELSKPKPYELKMMLIERAKAQDTTLPEGAAAALLERCGEDPFLLENGVDSIEHGAKMDEETIRLYKERGAFVCTTISPALPYALFDPAISGASEKDQYNGRIVFDGVVESARTALANGIPVGLGNDVGCPYVTQYDFWRELCYFHKYCGVSNQFALHTATLRNARLAGVGDVTGSIEAGKSADFIVTRKNPLDDLAALRQLELVVCRGRAVHKPAPKRNKTVDALLDPYLV